MAEYSANEWMVLGVIAACGIFAMLHAIATGVRNRALVAAHGLECAAVRERYLASVRETRKNLQEQVRLVGEDD